MRHVPVRRLWPAGLAPAATAAYTLAALAASGLVVIVISVLVVLSGPGAARGGAALSQTLVDCSGILALLALTGSVVLGVAATGRQFLPAPARVRAQVAHRAVSLAALGFLVVHILLEVVSSRAGLLAVLLPFTAARSRFYLGLGTIASDVEIAVVGTSLARMRYAGSAHPQLWRAVHLSIYAAWPLAILHGLFEQGGVAPWIGWSYLACVVLVAVAVATRLIVKVPLWRPARADPFPELGAGRSEGLQRAAGPPPPARPDRSPDPYRPAPASLRGASLRGASLPRASLPGASPPGASPHGAGGAPPWAPAPPPP
jgi:DMSO/TMAO reductase YedYZ heme-binding membrane subunit